MSVKCGQPWMGRAGSSRTNITAGSTTGAWSKHRNNWRWDGRAAEWPGAAAQGVSASASGCDLRRAQSAARESSGARSGVAERRMASLAARPFACVRLGAGHRRPGSSLRAWIRMLFRQQEHQRPALAGRAGCGGKSSELDASRCRVESVEGESRYRARDRPRNAPCFLRRRGGRDRSKSGDRRGGREASVWRDRCRASGESRRSSKTRSAASWCRPPAGCSRKK